MVARPQADLWLPLRVKEDWDFERCRGPRDKPPGRGSDFYPLASDGIVTSESQIKDQAAIVHGFVRATLKGMLDVIANPDEGFQAALDVIPELKSADAKTQDLQRKVLQATLPYWQSDLTKQQGLGFSDSKSWEATHTFLRDSGLLKSDVDLSKAFTNDFIK